MFKYFLNSNSSKASYTSCNVAVCDSSCKVKGGFSSDKIDTHSTGIERSFWSLSNSLLFTLDSLTRLLPFA